MADLLVTTGAPTTTLDGRPAVSPVAEVVRDIARGGIAGIIVGLLVAGLGGRLVMRLATILHEDTVGVFTENGEVIGNITFNGTMALITFGGLGMGLMAGTIWVIVSPWIPGRGLARALVTAVAAIALGTPNLVQRTNPDFVVLGYDPLVVVLLVGLVGLVGFSIALVDGALDARLPHPLQGIRISTTVYMIVTLMGLVLIFPLVVAILLDQTDYQAPIRAGWALAVVGVCTLIWWVLRVKGRSAPPTALRRAGTVSLLVAVVLGVVTSLPHILSAAGMPG
ncbi:MAG: hypothetical protein ACXWDJ_10890 [Aeromicrobium sp.]